jgi:hypothetical protein
MACGATAVDGSGIMCGRATGAPVDGILARLRTRTEPVESLWSHWKQHEVPNFCPKEFGALSNHARRALRRMRRRPALVMAFREQAELFPL